jgi:hypothetical protein
MERWICIRFDERRLWTADLYNGDVLVKNIGGSYPKASQVTLDAKRTWGNNLEVKVLPQGNAPSKEYVGEIEV